MKTNVRNKIAPVTYHLIFLFPHISPPKKKSLFRVPGVAQWVMTPIAGAWLAAEEPAQTPARQVYWFQGSHTAAPAAKVTAVMWI